MTFLYFDCNCAELHLQISVTSTSLIACSPPVAIVHNKNDHSSSYIVSQSLSDFVIVVNYKPPPGCLPQMHQHETVQRNDDDCLIIDWCEEITAAD